MLRLSERQLRGWEKQDLVPQQRLYAIPDIIVLRTLHDLRAQGVSTARIRRAVVALRTTLGTAADPLKEFRIFADGKRVVVQSGPSKMEPVSGQLLLDFDAREWNRTLSFPAKPAAAEAAAQARQLEATLSFERGLELEQRGAPQADVIQAYQQAIELDPASAGALVNLGTIHFHMRDWDRAMDFYQRAIEADPQYALAHFNIGNLFDEKGDSGQAMLHYMAALRLEPDYADAHYNLALLYQASGQVMRAVRHWRTYLQLDRSSSWAAIARQELDRLRRATVIEGTGSRGGRR